MSGDVGLPAEWVWVFGTNDGCDMISAPTTVDAGLDQLVHNAYRNETTGDSMRKKLSPLTTADG